MIGALKYFARRFLAPRFWPKVGAADFPTTHKLYLSGSNGTSIPLTGIRTTSIAVVGSDTSSIPLTGA